ncbi:hypothetical protein NVP1084O_244, partial [Vibrio phage 1.084.O._10N.261.49.F5]
CCDATSVYYLHPKDVKGLYLCSHAAKSIQLNLWFESFCLIERNESGVC